MRVLTIFIAAIVMSFFALVADATILRKFDHDTVGIIVGKSYKPSSTSTVTTVQANGQVGVGTVSTSRELKFIIIYDGKLTEADVDLETYTKYSEGDISKVKVYKGKIFGITSLKVW